MYKKFLIILFIFFAIGCFYLFDLNQYFGFNFLKEKHTFLLNYYQTNPIYSIAVFFIIYILVTALSLPGAVVMTVFGGAVFGFWLSILLVSFASTIGATLAFLLSKYLLHEYIQNRYGDKLTIINDGFRKEGAYYLFALRLTPIMPFFLINILFALTKMSTTTFYIVSQIGMLPGTILYVSAGAALANIDSPADLFSWQLLLIFSLLGLFPIIAKKVAGKFKIYRATYKFKKPKKYDYNVVVIGGGSAGLVSAYMASQLKAKVALIEKNKMGGDCLNTGCVPSKALIKSAKVVNYKNNFHNYGITKFILEFKLKDILERVQDIIDKISPHDSIERYTRMGVDIITADAKIIDPFHIKINEKVITTKKIILATGANPFVPYIPGLEKINYLTSENIWSITNIPKRMVILGGGPIGVELAQAFARLNVEVIIVERQDSILNREDSDVSDIIKEKLMTDNISIKTRHKVQEIKVEENKRILVCLYNNCNVEIQFDEILIALGRKANTKGFGLEDLSLDYENSGAIKVNKYLQTNIPNIYACGDVVGPYQFTHMASYQATIATLNSLFGFLKNFKVDYRVVPAATFCDPEIARVGINRKEAIQNNIDYDETIYNFNESDRAIIEDEDFGFIRVFTKKGSDKILGVTIVSSNASELISEFVLAMQNNLGLKKIMRAIHIYPTMSDGNRAVAGLWRKVHANQATLKYLEKMFNFLRR